MAIFAKKNGRGGNHQRNGQNQSEGNQAHDSVALDVPDAWQPRGAVTAGADTGAEPEKAEAAEAGTVTAAAASPAATEVSAPAVAAPSETPASVATARATGSEGDAIEPVDIEPEVVVAPTPSFGIEDAISLMRSLPVDPNIDLVVRVVRVTLGAVNVSVEDIMQDAERKEKRVRESIATLENDVADLEKQLHDKRAAISAHQADLRETATVRERLHMADKYTPHPPPLPPDARMPLPKPREWERFDSDTPFKDS